MINPEIISLAASIGVKISSRNCFSNHIFNGETIASHGLHGEFSDHCLFHEILHYQVAENYQRVLKEYGLGSVNVAGEKQCEPCIDKEERIIQEVMILILSAQYEYDLNLSPLSIVINDEELVLTSYVNYLYWSINNMSSFVNYGWIAIDRLMQKGLLEIPFKAPSRDA